MVQPHKMGRISRRNLIKGTGLGGTVFFAGCLGGDDDGGDDGAGSDDVGDDGGGNGDADGDTDDDSSGVDQEDLPPYTGGQVFILTEEINWNRFDPSLDFPYFGRLVEFVPLSLWDMHSDTIYGIMLNDWSLDGDTAVVEMNDWFTWTDGDDVTARDLATEWKIQNHLNLPPFTGETISSVEQTGDYTVELTLSDTDISESLFWFNLHDAGASRPPVMATKHDVYGEWLEALEDATSEDETNEIQTDLVGTQIDEPIGCGPFHWNPEKSENEKSVYDRRDDYPLDKIQDQVADQLGYDFSGWPDHHVMPETHLLVYEGRRAELMINDQQDANVSEDNVTDELLNAIPDTMTVFGVPRWGGNAILYNHDDPWFGDRTVRKAITHLMPRDRAIEIGYGLFSLHSEYQSGLANAMEDVWVSDELLDKLEDYPQRSPETAEPILEDAGFDRDGDTWYDPDGEAISFQIIAPERHAEFMLPIAEEFSNFGMDAEVLALETTAYEERLSTGDFQIASGFYGDGPHAYDSVYTHFASQLARDLNYPEEVTVPDIDDPSDTMTVNVVDLTEDLQTASSEEEMRDLVELHSWIFNQDLPRTEIGTSEASQFISETRFRFPEPNEDPFMSVGYCYWYAFHVGTIDYQDDIVS